MTIDQKKEMLQSMIDGAQWEGRPSTKMLNGMYSDSNGVLHNKDEWIDIKLGDRIDEDWEYRLKAPTYCVWTNYETDPVSLDIREYNPNTTIKTPNFIGTFEACKKYVAEKEYFVYRCDNIASLTYKFLEIKDYNITRDDWEVVYIGSLEKCQMYVKVHDVPWADKLYTNQYYSEEPNKDSYKNFAKAIFNELVHRLSDHIDLDNKVSLKSLNNIQKELFGDN